MKERLQQLLSEVGESFDYLRSDVRNLSRYMTELEELVEGYRTFAMTATLSTPADRAGIRKLAARKRTKSWVRRQTGNQRRPARMSKRRKEPLLTTGHGRR